MTRRQRAPEVRVLILQLIARFPSGMMTIALLTWAEEKYQSYVYGGLLVGVFTLGFAAGSSLSTRLFRNFSSVKVLRVDAILCGGCMLVLAYIEWDFSIAVVLAGFIGLTFPPVTPLARSLYPKLCQGPRLMRLYSFDAIAQESIWIFAPILAVLIAGEFGPSHVIAACAVVTLAGTLGFALLKVLKLYSADSVPSRDGARVTVPRVVIFFFVIGFFLVASGAFLEVYVVERFGYDGIAAGALLALVAIGSVVGGLAFARRTINPYSLAFRLMIIVVGLAAAAITPSTWMVVIGLFLSGVGIAPSFTAMHARIAIVTPASRTAEAYGFANTMQLIGLSAGSAVAGVLVSSESSELALLAGAGSAAVAVLLALLIGRLDSRASS